MFPRVEVCSCHEWLNQHCLHLAGRDDVDEKCEAFFLRLWDALGRGGYRPCRSVGQCAFHHGCNSSRLFLLIGPVGTFDRLYDEQIKEIEQIVEAAKLA